MTDRDRRLLWARAHNRCAICRKALTRDASTAGGDVVVADEAHIVARAEQGPRGSDGDREIIDRYDNLILLCKNDHKMVDDLPQEYPVDRLRTLKKTHEAWAESLFSAADKDKSPRVVKTTDENMIPFEVMRSGIEIWKIVSAAVQCNMGVSEVSLSAQRAELAHESLATLQDWSEISSVTEADGYRAVRNAITSLDTVLTALFAAELVLLARILPRRLEGGNLDPVPWDVAELVVRTADEVIDLLADHSMPKRR